MKLPNQRDKAHAWLEYGNTVIRIQALGWGLTWTTHRLLSNSRTSLARAIADADALLWGPIHDLESASTVQAAVRAQSRFDRVLTRTGLLDVFAEVEQEGRIHAFLLDTVAGKREQWQAASDALAGAVLQLQAVYPLAIGGRPDPQADSAEDLRLM